ncbi:DUF2637 domain-containing protein [Streptomyces sp. NPDC090442]|uniref:DUF2637 domain-containing protein n=1 Tax=Streptomyces sp. NPDC090442 TaxID=3365962 RepID=UPI003813CBE5
MRPSTTGIHFTRSHRILITVVAFGALVIAGIGFASSYTAVSALARQKGFGRLAHLVPIGVDVGIVVLLALDLLMAWLGMSMGLLRYTAWLLTGSTVLFNGASQWGDPVGVAMHSVVPVLFLTVVEAGRHLVARLTKLSTDHRMEGVRAKRWLLAPLGTARIWRRMQLWEIRSYVTANQMERDRLVYRARLRAQHGWRWRFTAPIEQRLPLRLNRYGIPLEPADRPEVPNSDLAGEHAPTTMEDDAHERSQAQPAVEAGPREPQRGTSAGPVDGTYASTANAFVHHGYHEEPGPAFPLAADEHAVARAPQAEDLDLVDAERLSPAGESKNAAVEQEHAPSGESALAVQEQQRAAPPTEPSPHEADPQHEYAAPVPSEPEAGEEGGLRGHPQDTAADDAVTTSAATTAVVEPAQEPKPSEHAEALATMKNADAVRYAIGVLNSVDTAELVAWLKDHGREDVNRGQAYRIAQKAAKR